jgi:hypothetical protein
MLLLTEFLSVDRIQQFVVVALDFVLLAKHRLSLLQLLFLFGSGNQARRNAFTANVNAPDEKPGNF